MAKYKVGDEVWVRETIMDTDNKSREYYMDCSENNGWFGEKDILGKVDEIMTAEEAWEIARKLCNMEGDERMVILGNKYYHMAEVYEDFTPQQAKAKIEVWEAEKEIKAGDVVYYSGAGKDCAIMSIGTNGYIYLLDGGGEHHICCDKSCLKKTGRHIDIQGLLGQIGGVVE